MKTGALNQTTSGVLNAGGWQLVEEKLLSSAATSVTFSNLNGDVDQEYRLISFIVAGANASTYSIRPNNDTGSNYGRQYVVGQTNVPFAGRQTGEASFIVSYGDSIGHVSLTDFMIYAKSGYIRTGLLNTVRDIHDTLVDLIWLGGFTWNNTADNITSLVVSSDVSNGLGVGTHLLLLKRNLLGADATTGTRTGDLNVQGKVTAGEFQKIYQTTLSAAATSVTISGLDGNTDTIYELRVRLISTVTNNTWVSINGDETADRYGYQTLQGKNTTLSASRALAPRIYFDLAGWGKLIHANVLLYAKSGYLRPAIVQTAHQIETTTVGVLALYGYSYNQTSDNITSLVIKGDATNGLQTGSVIELWALRKKV